MSKVKKTLIILLILIIGLSTIKVFATDEDSYEEPTETTSTSQENNPYSEDAPKTYTTPTTSSTPKLTTNGVSQVSSYDQSNLSINNVLNIILIAIGVLIILLGIAILVKFK